MKKYIFTILFSFFYFLPPGICAEESVPCPKKIPPVELSQINQSILKGLDFLLTHQRKNGSFGSALRTKRLNIYAPDTSHEGFHTGTSAICLSTLIKMEDWLNTIPADTQDAQLQELLSRKTKVSTAIDRCENWMMENLPQLRRSAPTTLYNVWGHSFGIQSLCQMYTRQLDLPPKEMAERKKKLVKEMNHQVELLRRYECLNGGWAYYNFYSPETYKYPSQHNTAPPNSFVTSSVLLAFHEAKELNIGVEIPPHIIRRGLESLYRQRMPNNAYTYAESHVNMPGSLISRPAGSLSRTLSGHLSIHQWMEEKDFVEKKVIITEKMLTDGLDRFITRIGWNDIGRKRPVPHESWFQIAGYFYYYGHYYAIRCVEQLQDSATQKEYANYLADILLGVQEPDGSWWDFPLYDYGHYYGTGMALDVLIKCREKFINNKI
ncbi:MAG: hypothetical protein Q4C96_08565 [Planctomycetia bacterium]|nr:hypothetical protein [Planctomycetia bacterium]